MKKRISIMLVMVLIISMIPLHVFAFGSAYGQQRNVLGLEDIGSNGYVVMKTSQMMLDILKVTEGYSQKAYSDNTQYSIGYGTKAKHPGEILPDGAAGYAEAEARLLKEVSSFEMMVNNYCKNSVRKQPNQHQFDAMVCFTYNVGSGWFFGSRLANWLRNPTTEIEFMNAFGQWCHVGTTPWYALAQRRIREALIFLKGEYYLPAKPGPEHLIKAEEFRKDPVRYFRPNGSLPYFASILMEFNSPTESFEGDRVEYRQYGDVIGELPVYESSHYNFNGWVLVAENNFSVAPAPVSSGTVVEKNLEIAIQWGDESPERPNPPDPDVPGPEIPEPEPEPAEPEVPQVEGLPFVDISRNSWYKEKVKFVYDNGYMAGTSKTRFSPDTSMTRAMLVMVLYRIAKSPAVTDEQRGYFEDTQGEYYTDAVAWAHASGIVDGVGNHKFAPSLKVTREDAELIFYKFCVNYLKVSTSQTADLSGFADLDELSDYANEAVQWAVAVKMMAGEKQNGKLCLDPKGNLSRAQAATLITRCVQDIIK